MINIIGNAIGVGQSKANPDFIMQVDTTIAGDLPDNQFLLRTHGLDVFQGNDFNVKTSDGQEFNNITANTLTITFPQPGIYDIRISGKFCGTKYDYINEGDKIIDILNWGDWEELQWVRAGQSFRDCRSLTTFSAKDAPYLGGLDSQGIANMFFNCTNLNADFSKWDVSPVSNFGGVFSLCINFNNDSICNWDMSNATSIASMFKQASSFNQDLSAWNTANVSSMTSLFDGASAFNGNVSNWDTSSLAGSLFTTFKGTSFNGDLSGWNVSNVNNLNNTFSYSSFNNNSIGNWNTSNVTNFTATFANTQFNYDLNNWDTSSATLMGSMFSSSAFDNGGVALNWDVSGVTNMSFMFYNCVFNQDVSSWDVSNVTTMQGMFQDRGSKTNSNMNISGWTTTSLQNTFQMFRGHGTNVQDLSAWDMSNNVNLQEMFQFGGMTFDPSRWDIQGAVNLRGIFNQSQNSSGVVGLWTFNNWNISQATDITSMLGTNVITTAAYNATLIAWAAQVPTTALTLNVNSTQYTLGGEAEAARTALINTYGWTITDGGGVAEVPFIMNVQSNNGTFSYIVTTNPSYTYDYNISTSDGQTFSNLTGDQEIFFPNNNAYYDIEITGTFPGLYVNQVALATRIIEIKQWGSQVWKTFDSFFHGCNLLANVTATDDPNTNLVDSMSKAFFNCGTITGIDFSTWNTSNVTTFSEAFRSTQGSSWHGQIVNWDTGKATNMFRMFSNVAYNQDLSNWDVSSVTNFAQMFTNNNVIDQSFAAWDIGQATLVNSAFSNFINTGTLSRANYDATLISWAAQAPTSNVGATFGGSQYTLGGAAEAARNTLINTYAWTITDGGGINNNFDFTVNTSITGAGSTGNTQFKLPLVSTSTVNATVDWGDGTINTVTAYDDPNATHTYSSTGTYDISIGGTLNGWSFNNTGDKRKMANISNWGCFDWTEPANVFKNCDLMTQTATDAPTISTTSMVWAFGNTNNWNGVVDNWDMSGVTDITAMFRAARVFNQPVNSWNTSNFVNTSFAFFDADIFNQPLNNWDMSNVTTGQQMFSGADLFNQDLSSWDISSVLSNNFQGLLTRASSFNSPLNWSVINFSSVYQFLLEATSFDQSLASWDISTIGFGTNSFMTGGGFVTPANYEATLVGWEAQAPPTNKTWDFGGSQYTIGSAGETARTSLINTYGWTIIDGGGVLNNESYLVASYSFDNNFTDYTGNHPLTASGNATAGVAGGKVFNCLEVDGVDDYSVAADSDDFSFTNGSSDLPFSISLWANADVLGTGNLVQKRAVTNQFEYQIFILSSQIVVNLFDNGQSSSQLRTRVFDTYTTGTWYHIVVTYDGSGNNSGLKVYINGSLPSQTLDPLGTYTGMANTTSPFTVGSYSSGVDDFDGKIDEVHVWKNRELTSAVVLDIYNTENAGNTIFPDNYTTDLVASYNFDTNFSDYTGVNNGTASGTPLAGQTGGVVNDCLLNNSSSYVDMGNDTSLQVSQYSVSAWFKCNLPGGSYRGIVVKQFAFGIFLQSNELGVYDWNGSTWIGTGQLLNDNDWHHVVFTFDDGVTNGAQIYLDGSPLGSSFTYAISNQSVPLVVGAGSQATIQSFNGNIDEVHVWANRLLDANEVALMYNTEDAGNSIL